MSDETAQTACFIDSNIWLYVLLPGQDTEKANTARELIRDESLHVYISTQVINEVVNGLIRHAALNEAEIREFIHRLYARCTVCQITESLQLDASRLRERYALSYLDSLIVSAALQSEASLLFTEDMQDRLIIDGRLTVVNPFHSPLEG